jgi:hypothetical protein
MPTEDAGRSAPPQEVDRSREYLGRYVCTAEAPYDPKRHGTHSAHPDAKVTGGSRDGACDDFTCPNCGTTWRDCYDDNS